MDNPNRQSRKWLLTIQKPTACGLTCDYINSTLQGVLSYQSIIIVFVAKSPQQGLSICISSYIVALQLDFEQ